MAEPEQRSATVHQLGSQEGQGVNTLEPGVRPPSMPPGRHNSIRVRMLDDTEEVFDVSQRAPGKVLFDLVCAHLNLIEGDYFGLEFQNQRKMNVWLDLLKPIFKQITRPKNTILRFVVKFFPPDQAELQEELTRYLFALQIKFDLASGRLTCNESSTALLVSHIIQSEIGDFDETQSRQHLLYNKYIPEQEALMDKILEYHRKHGAQTPAESDYQLLEIARKLEMYGIRLHPAKDREGSKLNLTVSHTGVLVFQGHTKINAFNWSKVRKLSFKRKRFLIKLRPDPNTACQDTLEFLMASRDCCKVFWKICVEYHAFFRLFEEPKPKPKPVLFTRGSSFRFSGRTQKQVFEYVKDSEIKKVPFERKHSKIQSNSSPSILPSQLRSDMPTESTSCTSGDKVDSPAKRSVDDSTALQNGGGREARTGLRLEEEGSQTPPTRQPTDHLSTGPASRAAKGSSNSIPYIDCSDIDSEYDLAKGQITRSHSRANDSFLDEPLMWTGSINGGYHQQRESSLGRIRYRDSPQSRDNGKSLDALLFSAGSSRTPLHSTLVEEILRGPDQQSPLMTRRAVGSRSVTSSPLVSTFHRTGSLSHQESNGRSSLPGCWSGLQEDSRRYGSYSPVVSRSPRLQKLQGVRNRSDTDPFVLSHLSSTPGQRRMVANGLAPSAQSKASPVRRIYGRPGSDHGGPVQMIDGSTSSGTESSDSESESGSSCSHPLVYGNPIATSSSPLPKNKFSFGSFQLDEDGEEDGFNFSDEDGAPDFRC